MRRDGPTAKPINKVRNDVVFSIREWKRLARELRLSERELEIVRLCFADLKEASIAGELAISGHTVHTHMERLYRKLGVCSRAALLVRVFAASRALLR